MKNVSLIIEMSNDYARGLIEGIHSYAQAKQDWSLHMTEHSRHETDTYFSLLKNCDGIIARIETPAIAESVKKVNVPTIDVSAGRFIPTIPWVETDDRAIVQMAIDHLMDCGLVNIAYFGDPFYNWSKLRYEYFCEIITKLGIKCHAFHLPKRNTHQVKWYANEKDISSWLLSLPKPIGIVCCADLCGQPLLEICKRYGIPVPEDIAAIGVDDDNLLCKLSNPPLSSVITNPFETGVKAASLLDDLMNGKKVEVKKYAFQPIGVHKRSSTDIVAIRDSLIAEAISIMRNNAHNNLKVEDILQHFSLSRRVFEKRFKKALNRTPHQQILRIRIGFARELLATTTKTLQEIAEIMNIENPEYFSVLFKREAGMTPSEYRRKVQMNNMGL
ncbi:MAG: DNA-binding transcriptional regulator [Sphaerochaeta sp.]|nr:DNA-binding transcriptional regulator [Sphaerochaeta sp.]